MNATLALGQVDVPILGGDGTSVERARQQFLEACAGYDAKLLRSLRAGPYKWLKSSEIRRHWSRPEHPKPKSS